MVGLGWLGRTGRVPGVTRAGRRSPLRSAGEDAFGVVAVGVQIPVDGGDLLGGGRRYARDGGGADRHVDGDVRGLDAGAGEFLVQVEYPVAQCRGGGVDVGDHGDGV